MPALTTPERALFDITQYPSIGFVYLSQPDLVFSAPLTGGFYSAGAVVALSYGTPTIGAYTDLEPEMTLELWDGDSNKYGSQRIRAAATSAAILVGRSAQGVKLGELTIADSAVIKVYKERKVFAKNPYISPNGTQYKDETAYSTDNAAQPPVANAGADILIIVPDDETEATIPLDALGDVPSFAVRNGASLSGYLWDLDDGAVDTGLVTDSSLTATFPLGERHVSLTVTDSNGITHTAYKFVVIATKAMCTPVKIAEEVIRPTGVSWRFTVNSDELPTGIREGTKVLYTQHDDYDLDQIPVRFSGWLGTETFNLKSAEKQQREIAITCYDIAERARQVYGFPLTVEIASGTSGWYRMPNANIDRLTHHYFQWHSNILNLADFSYSGQGATYPLPRFTTDGATLWEQGDRLARAIGYTLTCNTKGQIRVKGDPIILPTAAQAALYSLPTQRTSVEVTELTADDYGEFDIEAALPPRTYWLRGSAVVAGITNINAVKAAAPSKTPGQGYSSVEETEMLVVSQAELNARLANRYAARVNPRVGSVGLEMVKTRHVFEPADMEWVNVVFPDYVRAKYPYLMETGNRFLITEMVNRYDLEKVRKNTALTLEMEVEGVVNSDMTVIDPPPPISNPNHPVTTGSIWSDFYVPVEPAELPMMTIHGLPPASQNLLAVLTDGTIAVTSDFDTPSYLGGPTWTEYDHSADLGTDVRAFTYDASGTNSGVCGWFATPDDIIYGEDLETATPTFTVQSSFPATVTYVNIDADYAINPGLFVTCIFAIDEGSNNVYYARSTLDGGATWEADVELADVGLTALVPSGLHVDTHAEGTAWATVDNPVSAGWCAHYDFRTSDGGWVVATTGFTATAGTWVSGEGWTYTDIVASGHNIRGLSIEYTLPPATSRNYTTFIVEYSYTYGHLDVNFLPPDHPDTDMWRILNGGSGFPFLTVATLSGSFQGNEKIWSVTHPTSTYNGSSNTFRFTTESSNDNIAPKVYDGNIVIHSIEIHGTGVNPFDNDACAGADGLLIYQTSDFGANWTPIESIDLEDSSAGVLVPYASSDSRYLFLGNYADGTPDDATLADTDTNNLLRVDLTTNAAINISPVVATVPYGPVYLDNQASAPRGSFDSPTGNKNALYLLGSDFTDEKVGLFYTANALSDSPVWNILIEPDVATPYRKLVLDDKPLELYIFGINGSIGYTDSPTDGATIDSRVGNLSTSAEVIAICGFIT
jgi:hypothetical protein